MAPGPQRDSTEHEKRQNNERTSISIIIMKKKRYAEVECKNNDNPKREKDVE